MKLTAFISLKFTIIYSVTPSVLILYVGRENVNTNTGLWVVGGVGHTLYQT